MGQLHCSYSTKLTSLTEGKEGSLYRTQKFPKYASCLQQGTKVKLRHLTKVKLRNVLYCPEYKASCLGQIQINTSLSTILHIFQSWWWLHHVMSMFVIGKD